MADIIFTLKLPAAAADNLVKGSLKLKDSTGAEHTYTATSGLPRHQYKGAWNQRGKGCLPPSNIIPTGYTVATRPVQLPQVIGVEGPFFPIAPFEVNVNGVSRGDFGIHFDANVPGSSGCIVIPDKAEFFALCHELNQMQTQGKKALTLEVQYS